MIIGELWRRLRVVLRSDRFKRELKEEMDIHANLRAERFRRTGMPAEESLRAAQRQFGNTTLHIADSRSEWTFASSASLLLDIRYALRSFRNVPLFAACVAGTIGLGLGVICSLFTLFNAYVLRPFAVRDPYSLYMFTWKTKAERSQGFSWPEYERLRTETTVFSEILATANGFTFLNGRAFPGNLVTGNYFSMLGVQATLGRTLLPEDALVPGARPVVVVSYDAWRSKFASDPGLVGKKIGIRGHKYEVVGVARPEFGGLEVSSFKRPSPDFWVPITMAQDFGYGTLFNDAGRGDLSVVGRLKPEVTEQQAKTALGIYVRHATADLPEDERPIGFFLDSRATAIPLTLAGFMAFSVVMSIFGLVLLIACANVANMMLARGMARQREIGVRLALGAGRMRLVRQLLTEAVLLSLPGAAIGFAIAFAAARLGPGFLLSRLMPPEFAAVIRMPTLDPDIRVFLFSQGAAMFAAILFGLAPAIQATRTGLVALAKGDFGSDLRPARLRNFLVVSEVSLCVLFLVSACVLLGGSRQLAQQDTRMELARVVDIEVPDQFRAKIVERLAEEPWVAKMATTWRTPLYGMLRGVPVVPSGANEQVRAGYNFVSPEYFDVLGIPLKRGRNFTKHESDLEAPVVIVSESTARRFWPNQDPIGQSMTVDREPPDYDPGKAPSPGTVQVVGVAGDVISGRISDGIDATCLYFPFAASPTERRALLLRLKGTVTGARRPFAALIESVAPQSEWRFTPMGEVASVGLVPLRSASLVSWLLGGIALVLTVSGIYGVLSYLVSQRTKEIGIRIALGASSSDITRSVLVQSCKLAAMGATVGIVLAVALTRFMASHIELSNTLDPVAYLGGVVLAMMAALLAAYFPSRRAMRIDPAATLRSD